MGVEAVSLPASLVVLIITRVLILCHNSPSKPALVPALPTLGPHVLLLRPKRHTQSPTLSAAFPLETDTPPFQSRRPRTRTPSPAPQSRLYQLSPSNLTPYSTTTPPHFILL